MSELTYSETLTVISCWCGIHFAIPDNRYGWMKRSKQNQCYCPNGHQMHFAETMDEKLQRERERHQATRELLAAEERSHRATRGQLTKTRKQVHRAEHGVCPHCKRHFVNVERHVKTKHPERLA